MRFSLILLVLTNFITCIYCGNKKLYLKDATAPNVKIKGLFRNNNLFLYQNSDDATIKCFSSNQVESKPTESPKWNIITNENKSTEVPIDELRIGAYQILKYATNATCTCSQNTYDSVSFTMYRESQDIYKEVEWNDTKNEFFDNDKTLDISFNASTNALKLMCEPKNRKTEKSNLKFNWFLNGKPMENKDKFAVLENETRVLHLAPLTNDHAGVYMCVSENGKTIGIFNLKTEPSFKSKHGSVFSENKMEGDDVIISPELVGNVPQSFTWLYSLNENGENNETITTNDTVGPLFAKNHEDLAKRIKFYPNGDIINGRLEIKNLVKTDRAYFIASVTNSTGGVVKFSTLVRVKGKLDALWPFLGIVVEVIILVAIIFFYERRRAKRDAESEDTPDQKKPLTSTNNDNVRQRKA